MDPRTTSLLDALAHPGAAMLLVLVAGEATEAELLAEVPTASQPTANRRLTELQRIGVIVRDPGKAKAPGRQWRLSEPDPTESLLVAALDLSRALALAEERQRVAAAKRLKAARAKRLGIRKVDNSA